MAEASVMAHDNCILKGLVGSTAHGTGIAGVEDRDEMGVFIEPKENVIGLTSVDHYVHRTADKGMRSGPDDVDLTMYSLRKFVRLCVNGNPSVILLLWLPDYMQRKKIGSWLIDMRKGFISKRMGSAFLGYCMSQKKALKGERSKTVQRPELVEKHGYDTKFAMHAMRLCLQGYEILDTGSLSVPIREPDRTLLIDIRHGRIGFEEFLEALDEHEESLLQKVKACTLEVDRPKIDGFLVSAHEAHWSDRYHYVD